MHLLSQFMRSENKDLIMISSRVLEEFLEAVQNDLQPEQWSDIVDVYAKSIALSRPKPLYYNPDTSDFDPTLLVRDELHLHFLDHSRRIIAKCSSCIQVSDMKRLFDEVKLTLSLTRTFSQIANNPQPDLYFLHEQRSALRSVEILGLLFEDTRPDFHQFGEENFFPFCKELCENHLLHETQRRVKLLEPAICGCLTILSKLPSEHFSAHFHDLFPSLCKLISSESSQIRRQLQLLFQERIPTLVKKS